MRPKGLIMKIEGTLKKGTRMYLDTSLVTNTITHSLQSFIVFLVVLATGRIILQGVLCGLGIMEWVAGSLSTYLVFAFGLVWVLHGIPGMPELNSPLLAVTDILTKSTSSLSVLARTL